jgi:hypothetical protein
MMEYNDELVEQIDFNELDIGFLSMYEKQEDGTKILKGHSAIFKTEEGMMFNNKFPIDPKYLKHTRVYFGKKGVGTVFSELFATFLKVPGTIRYCYEMKQEEIRSEREYAAGNY